MIFYRIVLPMCMPVVVLIMVQTFMGNWNDFMGPLLYLRDDRVETLALGVYNRFSGASSVDSYANVQMAVGLYMMLPCAIVFFVFQKQLIDGIQLGAVKGCIRISGWIYSAFCSIIRYGALLHPA